MDTVREFQGSKRFLSNFFPAEVTWCNYLFPDVERAYQFAKNPCDEFAKEILRTKTPGEAKRLGKTVTLRSDWERVKIPIMIDLVRQKFANHPGLKNLLLATGDAELQEGNWWHDTFWGIDLNTGRGENHLGKILMAVRWELRK